MRARLIVALLLSVTLFTAVEASSWISVPNMDGTLAINSDRVGTVWYYSGKGQPANATLRIIWDGDIQGKVVPGTKAVIAWEAIQADRALLAQFLWIPHMDGTLGIPHRSIQALFFAPAEASKPAKLRIIHDSDTKVIEGAEAETLWKKLSGK